MSTIKVRPALFIGHHDWGYYLLSELIELLIDVTPKDEEVLTPYGLIDKYFKLSKDREWMGIVVDGVFQNVHMEDLTIFAVFPETLTGIFVPAGWGNDVIDEHSGLNKLRREERVKELIQRYLEQFLEKGYVVIRYEINFNNVDLVNDDRNALKQLEDTLKADSDFSVASLVATKCEISHSNSVGIYEAVVYDRNVFEETSLRYGQHLQVEEHELHEQGYFCVTADRAHSYGEKYFLKPRATGS